MLEEGSAIVGVSVGAPLLLVAIVGRSGGNNDVGRVGVGAPLLLIIIGGRSGGNKDDCRVDGEEDRIGDCVGVLKSIHGAT